MQLKPIDRVSQISKKEFLSNYLKPQKPLIIERGIEDWPAFTKWNLDYIAQMAGNKQVPLYDDRPISAAKKI